MILSAISPHFFNSPKSLTYQQPWALLLFKGFIWFIKKIKFWMFCIYYVDFKA